MHSGPKLCFGVQYQPPKRFKTVLVHTVFGSKRFQFTTVLVQTVQVNRLSVRFTAFLQIKSSRIKSKWTASERSDSGKLPKSKYKSSQIQNEASWALLEPARAKLKNAQIENWTAVAQGVIAITFRHLLTPDLRMFRSGCKGQIMKVQYLQIWHFPGQAGCPKAMCR